MKIHILAVGKVRGAYADPCAEYVKRLTDSVVVREVNPSNPAQEAEALLNKVSPGAFLVALDENGRDVSSRELAGKIASWKNQGVKDLVFVIGGADGLADSVKNKARFALSLGRKTWPHKLARVMLLEQLYRAQQINNGHPYHRD